MDVKTANCGYLCMGYICMMIMVCTVHCLHIQIKVCCYILVALLLKCKFFLSMCNLNGEEAFSASTYM